MVAENPPDPVVTAQQALAEATQKMLKTSEPLAKAKASITVAEAIVALIGALKQKAQAEIETHAPGKCVDNMIAFLKGPAQHNFVALQAEKQATGIVLAKTLPRALN